MFKQLSVGLLCLGHLSSGLTTGRRDNAAATLGKPSIYQCPRFRWWWPGGWIEPEEVTEEIQSIINSGFGGGEIGDVRDSITQPSDPKIYGWAQERWNKGLLAAYTQSNKMGSYVDLTLGPHWPTGFPGYTPDSPETMKELVHGQTFIEAGKSYNGSIPLPEAAPSGNSTVNNVNATLRLVAVLTARTSTTNVSASVVEIDHDSIALFTDRVFDDNKIIWNAPNDGRYVLVAVYGRGTGQVQNMYDWNTGGPELTYPWPAYIVDHFSEAGVEAGVKYWNENILTSEMRGALAKSGGSMFEDSLELKYTQYWTLNFLNEFRSRRGYDFSPFLLYVLKDTNTFSGDAQVAAQITNDFYQTVSDLYVNYRLKPLQKWVNSLGLKLRIQPYTASFDSSLISSLVDIPEGESLGFDGTPDSFRVLATGRDIVGGTVLSDELGAYFGKAYGVTWKFLLSTANHDMSLGVNQVVIHGYPYQTSQTSLWPGYAPFTPFGSSNGFADAWGPRQPQWKYATEASGYLANAQKLLQESGPSVDIAILNEDWGVTAAWNDPSLNAAGYSYQFPTPELLFRNDVGVRGGRLAPNGPAYKALVVNSTAMNLETAKLILWYGQKALPIVLVGDLPTTTFSYFSDGETETRNMQSVLSNVKILNTTATARTSSDVPAALKKLGVTPLAQYSSGSNSTLTTLRRTKDSGYVYWIYNGGETKFSGSVKLEGESQPFRIDLFSGSVSSMPVFSIVGGYTSVDVNIASGASIAIYLGENNPFDASSLDTYLVSTTCRSHVRDGSVYIASNASCNANTNTRKNISLSPAENLPSPISSFAWTLSVEDWAPAVINETGTDSYKTTKTNLSSITLNDLRPWNKIDGLETASGIGAYKTTFDINKNITGTRVLLDVGNVEGTWGLEINGKTVTEVDWFGSEPLDVTDYIVNGNNELQITVATTLWNKLIEVWPAVYGSLDPQEVGLTGPVTITYVSEKRVN
ncbi:unnamed protein product [Clonostachys byssicola]|uniref:Secreted protein n=1 Tax=Clonostachys byssicola TaxID=160290 RepID=A0A9N9USQ0_9HYPO|nr:unnamed protein product [Clonostachys byssicola]